MTDNKSYSYNLLGIIILTIAFFIIYRKLYLFKSSILDIFKYKIYRWIIFLIITYE